MFKDYNMNQLVLPLDIEMKLSKDDIAFSIDRLVESIPNEAFHEFRRDNGCPAYHPKMMLKIILCAYTQSTFSGRKIEDLPKDSLRIMWLAQGHQPTYRTINRFRVQPAMNALIKECFIQFRNRLVAEDLIDQDAIFIDGTKIEADANKFTFVWKRAVEKYLSSLTEKSKQMYEELFKANIMPALEVEEGLTSEQMSMMADKLEEHINEKTAQIESTEDVAKRKKIRSERKEPKKLLKLIKDMLVRKHRYEIDLGIMGERNSYSKTDKDATFMRMKDDYMRNGQLKPGYNLQIATENQYTLAYAVFPNPSDSKTMIPFLDKIEEEFFELPEHIVADAGYGSEPNYNDILVKRQKTPLITYGQYLREQKRSYKNNPFQTANWTYDESTDSYECPNSKRLNFSHMSVRRDKTGFERHFKVYRAEDCGGCPFRSQCTRAYEGTNRTMSVNVTWEEQKEYVRTKLSDEETGSIYRRRKTDVEPAFGFLKANLGFTRASVRTRPKVENDIGLALMAVNLRKYAARV